MSNALLRFLACGGLLTVGFHYGEHRTRAQPDAEMAAVSSPREMLRAMNIDDSQLYFFVDDRPLVADENETLWKLMFRLPSFPATDVERWARSSGDWKVVIEAPDEHRAEFFEIRGQVVRVQVREVLPEAVPRLGFRKYFEVTFDIGEIPILVCSRQIPRAWQDRLAVDGEIDQHASCYGLFLKRGTTSDGRPQPVFATSRIAWHPTEENAELRIDNDHVLLAGLGMDVGLLDDVIHRVAIRGEDRECFYQLLAAMDDAHVTQLANQGRTQFDIARMIQEPKSVTGQLYSLSGVARRAVRIRVDDPDIRQRCGIDHYFEVEVFLPLERNVRFVDPSGGEDKVFTDYPFVYCLRRLPEGMPLGDDIHQTVRASGFFMKLWAYKTQFMSANARDRKHRQLQLSPLLIGPSVEVLETQPDRNPYLGAVVAVLFTIALLAIWLGIWRSSVGDRRFARAKLFRRYDLEDSRSLRQLASDDQLQKKPGD